jgi:hypothetical protein
MASTFITCALPEKRKAKKKQEMPADCKLSFMVFDLTKT